MRKVILSLGLAIGVAAWAVGLVGLFTRPYDHGVPVPYDIVAWGACAMMGTLVIFVITFAHGSRAGDVD